jgi:hypothetical protein
MERVLLAMGAALAIACTGPARAGSETPPEGPPWVRELAAAQTQALAEGKAIFVYLTKTY